MKVYKDLNDAIRAGRISPEVLRREHDAAGILGWCLSLSIILVMVMVLLLAF